MTSQSIAAFFFPRAAESDQRAQIAVAFAIGGQQHELEAVIEPDFASDYEFERSIRRKLFDRFMGAHDAGDRAFVGDGQRAVSQLVRFFDQLVRMGGAAQKAEVGKAVQLRISGEFRLHGTQEK